MAPKTQKNKVNRLDYNIPIVHADGRPTDEFQRKWLQQAAANATVPDLTTIAGVSAILDLISAVKGSLLTRGTTTWQALAGATGHDGWLLTWNDATGLPEWRVSAISAIPAAFYIDGAGVGQMALVDVNGQEVLDASGFGVYISNPVLPIAMLPAFPAAANPSATAGDAAVNGVATTFMRSDAAPAIQLSSSTLFGLAKVDNVSILALAGVLATKACAFYAIRSADQSVVDSTNTTLLCDSVLVDTLGNYVAGTGKFTPIKAGKWFFFSGTRGQVATAMSGTLLFIYKNAVLQSLSQMGAISAGNAGSSSVFSFAICDMNGTTDFAIAQAYVAGTGGSDVLVGSSSQTFFGGLYLGA